MKTLFKHLPAVDAALKLTQERDDLSSVPRAMLRELINEFLDLLREEIRSGAITREEELAMDSLAPRLMSFLKVRTRPHFRRVLNGTGVVVHTNLGRSILCPEAIQAVQQANAHYSNLEFDLATGKRGSRYSHVEELLCRVSGAEAGLVVNNNAAAVLLVLDTLCKGREVIVSRGQLVEIGGSFRIPAVMEKSGAILREVGATNRTHVHDYENAVTSETAAFMKVHCSNFRVIGFTKEVSIPEMAELGRRFGLPVIEDLGSGNFYDFSSSGLGVEPTVRQTVEQGADVVTFSGDKVLGGPQAGIIVGRKEFIDRIKKNQLNRALRIDKMTLAALEATLRFYIEPETAGRRIPTLDMITAPPERLKAKAMELSAMLRERVRDGQDRPLDVSTMDGNSRVGGGAFPERPIPTTLVRIGGSSSFLEGLRNALLATDPPLVGRMEEDGFCLDPRTLSQDEFPHVCEALNQALQQERADTGAAS